MKKVLAILLIATIALTSLAANGAAEATDGTDTVRVAYMTNYASLCSVMAGIETGAFADEGINVELVEFADGPTIIAAMESGSIDIGYIGHGAHSLCINGRAKIFAFSHVGNGDAVIGLRSHGVTEDFASLAGKSIGYASGTSSELILRWALEEAGLTMDDVVAYEMDAAAITSAMTSGSLDACANWSPATFTILDAMGDDAFVVADNVTFADRSASVASWIVMNDWAEENHDLLVRFTRALYKGMDYRAANIEETAQWVANQLGASYDTIYAQRGDAEWLTSAQLIEQTGRPALFFFIRMCVNIHRGRQLSMSQQFLYIPRRCSATQQVGRGGVPQQMKMKRGYPCRLCCTPAGLLYQIRADHRTVFLAADKVDWLHLFSTGGMGRHDIMLPAIFGQQRAVILQWEAGPSCIL